MIELATVSASFPELRNLSAIPTPSGQKYVFTALLNGRKVVLKLIKLGQDRERTLRETSAVKKLGCSFVPTIMDTGDRVVGTESLQFIIEEFIDGEDLCTRLRRAPRSPINEVVSLGRALLRGCEEFEKAKLVHRDIKPANIMIDKAGKVWIIDFGITRHLDLPTITPGGSFGPGTPGYAAPEQFRNLKTEINVRADLYSTGVVVYEALNGSNPYLSILDPLQRLLYMEANDLPPLIVQGPVTAELSRFLSSMTSRYPSRRPQSAAYAIDWFEKTVGAVNP